MADLLSKIYINLETLVQLDKEMTIFLPDLNLSLHFVCIYNIPTSQRNISPVGENIFPLFCSFG